MYKPIVHKIYVKIIYRSYFYLLQDITYALQSNYSMRHIPFPTYDLQAPMKAYPERVDAMVRRMQDYLQRNSNPRSYASRGKNFRLTQVMPFFVVATLQHYVKEMLNGKTNLINWIVFKQLIFFSI